MASAEAIYYFRFLFAQSQGKKCGGRAAFSDADPRSQLDGCRCYYRSASFFWRERKLWRYLAPSCELTAGGNYLVLADLRFDARFAISSLSTFSMKLERVLFSAFASATSLDFNARSVLKDIVVSFTVAANNTL